MVVRLDQTTHTHTHTRLMAVATGVFLNSFGKPPAIDNGCSGLPSYTKEDTTSGALSYTTHDGRVATNVVSRAMVVVVEPDAQHVAPPVSAFLSASTWKNEPHKLHILIHTYNPSHLPPSLLASPTYISA